MINNESINGIVENTLKCDNFILVIPIMDSQTVETFSLIKGLNSIKTYDSVLACVWGSGVSNIMLKRKTYIRTSPK